MAQAKNTSVSEPFDTKGLTAQERRRLEKWPDMRFSVASLYRVSKASEAPQFEEIMEVMSARGVELQVLARGDREADRKYIGPTRVLLGEPMEEWQVRQRDEQEFAAKRLKTGAMSLPPGHEPSVSEASPTTAMAYSGSSEDELS